MDKPSEVYVKLTLDQLGALIDLVMAEKGLRDDVAEGILRELLAWQIKKE